MVQSEIYAKPDAASGLGGKNAVFFPENAKHPLLTCLQG
jgi:hypothetical protein